MAHRYFCRFRRCHWSLRASDTTRRKKEGSCSPFVPVRLQTRIEGTVGPFHLLMAKPVETRMGQQRDHFALRGVLRGHRELLAVDPREAAIGLRRGHLLVP